MPRRVRKGVRIGTHRVRDPCGLEVEKPLPLYLNKIRKGGRVLQSKTWDYPNKNNKTRLVFNGSLFRTSRFNLITYFYIYVNKIYYILRCEILYIWSNPVFPQIFTTQPILCHFININCLASTPFYTLNIVGRQRNIQN